MPSVSKSQQHFMGAELQRKREGKSTQTGMSEKQLKDFAATKTKDLPSHKKEGRGSHSDDHSGHGRHRKGRGEFTK